VKPQAYALPRSSVSKHCGRARPPALIPGGNADYFLTTPEGKPLH
jgi:hypothetical protein